jgi:hypothetical protein
MGPVAVAGFILLLLAFAVLAPRGATPGSIANRNVPLGSGYIQQTPGYQEAPVGRARWARIGLGLACLAAGVGLLALGL